MARTRLCTILLLFCCLITAVARGQQNALVKAASLSLRKDTSTKADKVGTLATFQPVKVLERKTVDSRKWARLQTRDGKDGWALADYLTTTGFVWVDHDKANGRQGPGTEYPALFEYGRHLPLAVLDVAPNGWLKVMDMDGDRSWLSPSIAKTQPSYVVARYPLCNVRKSVGVNAELAFTAERGYILQVLGEKEGWLRVKAKDGDEGWMSAKIVFGWLDEAEPKPDAKADPKADPKPEAKASASPASKSRPRSKAGPKS